MSDWLATNLQDPICRASPASATSTFSVGHTRCASGSTRQAAELRADAKRRHHRDPEPEYRSRGRRDRRHAAAEGQMLNATVTAQSQLQTPEQFRNIIVKADPAARACARRRGAGRTRRRELFGDHPRERPSRRGHRHLRSRRARTRFDRRSGQGKGRRRSRSDAAGIRISPTPTTRPTSSSCRSRKSSRR